ncbi:MAG: site-specific DNA-methyltransferase, partial [Chloroflexi bacterium HGW-Chloroflexi-8]
SGTTGAACLEFGRKFVLIDNNPQSIQIMAKRFADAEIEWIGCEEILGQK